MKQMKNTILLATLLAAGGLAPGIVAAATLTPLVEPASQEHHVGKVIFVELVTPDLAAAKTFYAGLFGWTFRDVPIGGAEYAEASLNGHPVAGIARRVAPSAERRQPAWLDFIAVNDVDAASKTALQGGAKLLSPPHSVPGRGREAVFADPQGAVFAVLASSSGDPPDVLAAPGEWIWSSLSTSDPETDAAFYQTLFDYEVFDLPADPGAQHLMLASESFARASANTLPENRPKARAHWLSYVRVDDVDASVARLTALGGRVLVEPRVDRHGGKVAVVADPLGAAFGLLEWAAGDSKEVGE
jgi:predicted enzyme related to lactoylglutathione lyase